MNTTEIKEMVQDKYGAIAKSESVCGCGCSGRIDNRSETIGYSKDDLKAIPAGANLGLGCGNPTAIGSLEPGETVLDLGSGAGMDCFLAARKVGPTGFVIGVDMTPAMIDKAVRNAEQAELTNISFRLGDIEKLPVADNTVDVVLSNCVINLVPDKRKVFREIYRVLKPGGRVMIADIALDGELPPVLLAQTEAYIGCIAGAIQIDTYKRILEETGFERAGVVRNEMNLISAWLGQPDKEKLLKKWGLNQDDAELAARAVQSVKVAAFKPKVA